MKWKNLNSLFFALALIGSTNVARAQEIGFYEKYALADDRSVVLSELIPGTETYYFYHCLYNQSKGQHAEAQSFLDQWLAKFGLTDGVRRMQTRQQLLSYSKNNQATLEYLRNELGVNIYHSQPVKDQAASLPVSLDPGLINWEERFKEAITSGNRLEQISGYMLGNALPFIQYEPDFRGWLSKVTRNDAPGLLQAIKKELAAKDSQGFGWAPIHSNLTLEQLKQLRKEFPKVAESDNYARQYMDRLRPNDDESLQDPVVREKHLNDLESFVTTLPDTHNSLKATVLYHRLKFDQQRDRYDKARFLQYLRLPRNMPYVNAEFARKNVGVPPVNFGVDYSPQARLAPINDDQQLIQEYLERLLQSEKNVDDYAQFLNRDYLTTVFAVTKILYGIGDLNDNYAQLNPDVQREVRERIELGFLPVNKTYHGPEDKVSLRVQVKNVPQLIVKIYKLNTRNLLQSQLSEITTNVDVDGFVANVERRIDFNQPAQRRHEESLELPELDGRGVWVVDLLGGGQRARTMIHKGQLRSLRSISDVGHVLTVLDESGKHVKSAKVLMGEREFTADEQGDITIPFGEADSTRPIVLVDGNFASLETIEHRSESYILNAGFLMDPQMLLAGSKVAVTFRPDLICNGQPIDIKLLENATLTVSARDADGISTSQTFSKLELSNAKEATQPFLVPQRAVALTFTLKGRVFNQSKGIHQDVSATHNVNINGVSLTMELADMYLSGNGEQYRLEVRGRNGEPIGRQPVTLQIHLEGIVNPVVTQVATDARGIAELGTLSRVLSVVAMADGIGQRDFALNAFGNDWPTSLNSLVGEKLALSLSQTKAKYDLQPSRFSLVETREGRTFESHNKAIKISDGLLVVEGLPAGTFVLTDHYAGASVNIYVTQGVRDGRYLIGKNRSFEAHEYHPVAITNVRHEGEKLTVKFDGVQIGTRIHIIATAFDAGPSKGYSLRGVKVAPHQIVRNRVPSFYLNSVRLDEEYQYVLQRQLAKKFPGNMLPQPSVLLNPWELSTTSNSTVQAASGDPMAAMSAPAPAPAFAASEADMFKSVQMADETYNYDFLTKGALLLANLLPNDQGEISLDTKALNGLNNLTVVVVHPTGTTYRQFALPAPDNRSLIDQRLAKAFDKTSHRADRQRVRVIQPGDKIDLGEAKTTRVRVYASLSDVFQLYATLLNNAEWEKFRVLTQWNTLNDEQKAKAYNELASHEMELFIYNKDRAFFDKVIRPYLAMKMEKQFVDAYLLGSKLDQWSQPWQLARMNTVERILMSRSFEAQREATRRWLGDTVKANPMDSSARSSRFDVAMLGNALDSLDQKNRFGSLNGQLAENELLMRSSGAVANDYAVLESRHFDLSDSPNGRINESVKEWEELGEGSDKESANRPGTAGFGGGMGGGGMGGAGGGIPGGGPGAPPSRAMKRGSAAGRKQKMFASLEATRKWAESQFYHVGLERQTRDLVPASKYWLDYLNQKDKEAFVADSLDLPTHTINEAIMALAVLDLPFESTTPELSVENDRLLISTKSAVAAYVQSIEKTETVKEPVSVLVGQDIYLVNPADSGQALPVQSKPLVRRTAYRTSVVVTNPTSTVQKVQVLTQLPQGAIALSGGRTTRGVPVELQPYSSQQVSYEFYFPESGNFEHYGAQISNSEGHLAAAESTSLKVLDAPDQVDKTTWAYIAAWGTNDQVLEYLTTANLLQLDMNAVAWRVQDKEFFTKILNVLRNGGRYDDVLWSYSIKHNDPVALREYLEQSAEIIRRVGPVFQSDLVTIDPTERFNYQHFDFRPLVTARAHQLGAKRKILNDGLALQYKLLADVLSYQSEISDSQRLAITYYLILQNRTDEALDMFARVDRQKAGMEIQYDYFDAYLDMYRGAYDHAKSIAAKYGTYPHPRWRGWFEQITAQIKEREQIENGTLAAVDTTTKSPDEQQRILDGARETDLASSASLLPSLDVTENRGDYVIQSKNIDSIVVNYYLMDVELLFSRNPFVQQDGKRISATEPNMSQTLKIDPSGKQTKLIIPEELKNRNMVIEAVGSGLTRSLAVYANELEVEVTTAMGRLQVLTQKGRQPIAGSYVKVYARNKDGSTLFYKDGYTDLRGRFDYATLSTSDMTNATRFAILVLDPKYGAVVREAEPPKN